MTEAEQNEELFFKKKPLNALMRSVKCHNNIFAA